MNSLRNISLISHSPLEYEWESYKSAYIFSSYLPFWVLLLKLKNLPHLEEYDFRYYGNVMFTFNDGVDSYEVLLSDRLSFGDLNAYVGSDSLKSYSRNPLRFAFGLCLQKDKDYVKPFLKIEYEKSEKYEEFKNHVIKMSKKHVGVNVDSDNYNVTVYKNLKEPYEYNMFDLYMSIGEYLSIELENDFFNFANETKLTPRILVYAMESLHAQQLTKG